MKATLLALSTILVPLALSSPMTVDVHITEDSVEGKLVAPARYHETTVNEKPLVIQDFQKQEQIPGWIFIEQDRIRARIHANTFWSIKGKLESTFPIHDFLFDPLLFKLSRPEDFEGNFNGTIGQGAISLSWEKSGASITGRSPIGDFEIKGSSQVDYSQ